MDSEITNIITENVDRACKQQRNIKGNANKKDTYSQKQKVIAEFLLYITKKDGIENLALIGNIERKMDN